MWFLFYSVSPGRYRRKYVQLRKVQLTSRKRLYAAKKTEKVLKRKITNLNIVVEELKKNTDLSENARTHLNKCFQDIPHILMRRYMKNVERATTSRASYPEALRKFACTLQFYSAKAYEYVRKTFALALPHQSVIRKWMANIECHPGFSDVCFDALRQIVNRAKTDAREIICSLMLDEMAIKKQIDFDGKRAWGYVDIGMHVDNDDLDPASQALVLMVVCHTSHWKLPIGYFFIKSLTAEEKANLVSEALIRLYDVGIVVTSVTCDGPSTHFKMLKELGCKLDDVFNMKTFFEHPADDTLKVFCILDVCHMLKLMRNLLGGLKKIKSRDGIVDWTFITRLYDLQEKETLRLANKLKKSHIAWERQKMKVCKYFFRFLF